MLGTIKCSPLSLAEVAVRHEESSKASAGITDNNIINGVALVLLGKALNLAALADDFSAALDDDLGCTLDKHTVLVAHLVGSSGPLTAGAEWD